MKQLSVASQRKIWRVVCCRWKWIYSGGRREDKGKVGQQRDKGLKHKDRTTVEDVKRNNWHGTYMNDGK